MAAEATLGDGRPSARRIAAPRAGLDSSLTRIGRMKRIEDPPSNTEWRRWGTDDPFYGVATWEGRDRGGPNPWTALDFYALGASDWADFRSRWVAYGNEFGRVVDVGCGAGRLTRAMAADFREVIGVDVSEGMLKVARLNTIESNVELRLGDGISVPVETSTVDGAFSAHVFQHFDSLGLARANFSEIARILKPGGTMMVHLPVVLPPEGLPGVLPALAAKQKLGDVRAKLRRRRGTPFMRGLQYPWQWLLRELPALGLVEIELIVFATRSNGGYHPCILARRS
jgi:SAM-dependent methyltransferase